MQNYAGHLEADVIKTSSAYFYIFLTLKATFIMSAILNSVDAQIISFYNVTQYSSADSVAELDEIS